MWGDGGWFLLGLVALVLGAEVMVRGGAEVAARLGISPIVIGLTVVSIGTSLPELAVGVVAASEGSGALAVGNIAGTNVVNLLLILGLSALILPLTMATRTLRFELPVMAGAAVLMLILALIGLTVVAIGTSAPELVTTVVSTLRGNRDIAIGNLLGSSIYNILLILGATCLVSTEGLVLPASLVRIDIPIMVAVALACIPIFVTGRRVGRGEGGAMVVAYVAYLAFLLTTQS